LNGVLNAGKPMKVTKQNSKPGFPELRGSIGHIKWPAWAEVKYDGELAYVMMTPKQACTINKYGTIRENFPALDAICHHLRMKDVEAGIFLGELYHGGGKLHAIYDLNSNKSSDTLNLKIFDVVQINKDLVTDHSLLDRKEYLAEILDKDMLVEGCVVEDAAACDVYFEAMKANKYEGIVVKEFESKLVMGPCSWAKMKGKERTEYLVSLVDQSKERIEVTVPTGTKPGLTLPSSVKVGVKAPNRYKKHISKGDRVTIEHQGVLPSGSLRHPVLIPDPSW